MAKPVLVVMAAGMGSRYGGLKQLDPVGPHGELIIDYSIYDARRAGFETVVFVIKRPIEDAFKAAIGDRLGRSIEVKYAFQEMTDLPGGYTVPETRKKPWGTAHAVLAARDIIHGPFAVINADDYYGPEAFRVMYDYLASTPDGEKYEYAMVGYRLGNTVTEHGSVARGICVEDGAHFLQSVVERTDIVKDGENGRFTDEHGVSTPVSGDAIVSMNLWGFTESFLREAWTRFPAFLDKTLAEAPEKGEYYIPYVVNLMLDDGVARVKVLRSGDRWYGVTYREDKPQVMAAMAQLTRDGIYPPDLWGE